MDEAFLVAGGPSLANFDWNLLQGKFVVAINRAYEVLPDAQIIYYTDHDFERNHLVAMSAHGAKLVRGVERRGESESPYVEEVPFTGEHGLETEKGKVRHGHNSTYGAINYLFHLGFKKMYLLGVDMKFDKGKSHWHSGHPRIDPEDVYQRMMKAFETLKPELDRHGIEVINLNPNSALNVFPKQSWGNILDT